MADGFTVLQIISIIQHGIHFIVSTLQPGSLILKVHQKNIATLMKGCLLWTD